MRTTRTFDKLAAAWAEAPRYISSEGGTRSGKTFSALQLLIFVASNDNAPRITSVVSETLPHLKRGAIRDFKEIMCGGFDDAAWSKTDNIYTFPNGSIIEFFGADSPAKVHGAARDRLFINEAQNISYDVFRQLEVRTRGTILIDFNPTHAFWAHEILHQRPNCNVIHSTYKDNDFLTEEQVQSIEANRTDANWWRVYGEGKVGTLEGVIFPDFEQVDTLPEVGSMTETWGMDFGFTNDPTTLVHVLTDTRRREVWFDCVCYRRGMLNADIIAELGRHAIRRQTAIYADCAEPKTIAEICGSGYNCKPCYKATRKAEQLQMMRGYKIHVTKTSVEMVREMRCYVWQTDKDGKALNEPTPFNDHAMDAARYGMISHLIEGGNGLYRIK